MRNEPQLVGQVRRRTLQRVGEDKLSFVGRPGADCSLLRVAIDDLRVKDKSVKDEFEAKELANNADQSLRLGWPQGRLVDD